MTKVLLVEDDNNLREIYEARLAAEGYDISTAKDGEDALAVAKQQKPELIISDVMMPRISGFEMLDILRNTDGLKHAKVIMLTALGQNEDKTRADNLGADRYLVKSQVTLEDIVKAAEELLNPDAQTDDTTANVPETPATSSGVGSVSSSATGTAQAGAVPGVVTAPIDPNADMPANDGSIPTLPSAQPQPNDATQGSSDATMPGAPAEPPKTPDLTLPTPTEPTVPAPAAQPAPAEPTAAVPQPEPASIPQPAPTAATPTPAGDSSQASTPSAQPVTDPVAGAPATEPHTVITPPSQDNSAPVAEPATPVSEPAVPAPATPAAEPATTPPAPPTTSDTPFITQSQPQAQPEAVPAAPSGTGEELPVIESPNMDVQQPVETTPGEAAPTIQMPQNPSDAVVPDAQSTNQEEATVEKQIENFVNEHQDADSATAPAAEAVQPQPSTAPVASVDAPQDTPPAEPAVAEPGNDNDKLITNAMNDLLDPGSSGVQPAPTPEASQTGAVSQSPSTDTPPAETATDPVAAQTGDGNTQITGRKVLQPITSEEKQADLSDLVAQEEVKENIAKGVTGDAVVSDVDQQKVEQTPPGVTPSPPQSPHESQQPGGVFTPNTGGDADANAL